MTGATCQFFESLLSIFAETTTARNVLLSAFCQAKRPLYVWGKFRFPAIRRGFSGIFSVFGRDLRQLTACARQSLPLIFSETRKASAVLLGSLGHPKRLVRVDQVSNFRHPQALFESPSKVPGAQFTRGHRPGFRCLGHPVCRTPSEVNSRKVPSPRQVVLAKSPI